MNSFTLVASNLRRRPSRTMMMTFCVATVFFVVSMLFQGNTAIRYAVGPWAENRLTTTNLASHVLLLPRRYVDQVRTVPGVERVTYATFVGAFFGDPTNDITAYAVEPESWLNIYSEWVVDPAVRKAFIARKDGVLVGEALAGLLGLKVGDDIAIGSARFKAQNGSSTAKFHVTGIFRGRSPHAMTFWMIVHHERFDELRADDDDTIGFTLQTIRLGHAATDVARRIDALFAKSAFPTITESSNDYSRNFFRQVSDYELLFKGVGAAALTVILLVVATTMTVAVFERREELAVLRSIGFSTRRIWALILWETLCVVIAGGIIGFLMYTLFSMNVGVPRAALMLSLQMILPALLVIVLLGCITAAIPALVCARMNVARALAKIV